MLKARSYKKEDDGIIKFARSLVRFTGSQTDLPATTLLQVRAYQRRLHSRKGFKAESQNLRTVI